MKTSIRIIAFVFSILLCASFLLGCAAPMSEGNVTDKQHSETSYCLFIERQSMGDKIIQPCEVPEAFYNYIDIGDYIRFDDWTNSWVKVIKEK